VPTHHRHQNGVIKASSSGQALCWMVTSGAESLPPSPMLLVCCRFEHQGRCCRCDKSRRRDRRDADSWHRPLRHFRSMWIGIRTLAGQGNTRKPATAKHNPDLKVERWHIQVQRRKQSDSSPRLKIASKCASPASGPWRIAMVVATQAIALACTPSAFDCRSLGWCSRSRSFSNAN
jgi:hypothetical protein